MPQLNATQEAAFRAIAETLGPALSNAFSENLGRLTLIDDPLVETVSLDDLMRDADTLLQTNFSLPALGPDELMMIVSGVDALELGALISGAATPEPELTDASLATLSPAMQGIAQGIGFALGNATDRPIQASGFICFAAPISVGVAFVTAETAIALRVAYHVQDGPDGSLTLYFTPAAAASLVASSETQSADTAAAEDVIDLPESSDLAGTIAGFFGGQETGPGFGVQPSASPLSAFDGPLSGGPMGGSPIGGGPLMGGGSPFQAFESVGPGHDGVSRSMDLIMDIPLDVSVELGRVQMLIKDVLELATGSIVELERVAGEPVDLLVNGQLIAKGEVVVIEDNFGIRITEIVSPADRLHGMAKRAA